MRRRLIDPGLALAALCAASSLAGCGNGVGATSAFELRHSLACAQRVHVGTPDAVTLELARAAILRRPPAGLDVRCTLEDHVAPGADEPRIWIGTPASRGAEDALHRLGVAKSGAGFRFQGVEHAGRGDALLATVADPGRPHAVLELFLANDLATALRWDLDWTPTSHPGWQLFEDGAVTAEGSVGAGGEVAGVPIDVAALEASGSGQRGECERFDWRASATFDPQADAQWLERLGSAAERTLARLEPITPFHARSRLELLLLDTPEDLARVCRARGFASSRQRELQDQLALVHHHGAPDNAAFELARATALAAAGPPRSGWLADAVAAEAAGAWFERPLASWLAHLWTGNLVPPVDALVRGDRALSPHVAAPLRAALLQACEELHGADFAAKTWSAAPETVVLPSDDEFRAFLARQVAPVLDAARARRVERRASALARTGRCGVCLLPSPSRTDPLAGGFGSQDCADALAKLKQLGATAVALCWSSAIEESEPRVFGAGRARWSQADDAALYSTILRARELGLEVVLLPQLVAAENGGWAGEVLLTTSKTRRELFAAWRAEITHVGLLAELAGADVLSLGSEAPGASVTLESSRNRRTPAELAGLRADWRFLIEAARDAFGGGLTYAARWDGEAQGIEFWSELDFVGQNLFAPLGEAGDASAPDSAGIAARLAGALGHLAQLARLAQEHDGRALVTSIGISSTADGWRQPARPAGAVDLAVQTRFYDGLRRALQTAHKQGTAPAGWFAWCWWTDAQSGGAADRGFTPQNKPAEAALQRALKVR